MLLLFLDAPFYAYATAQGLGDLFAQDIWGKVQWWWERPQLKRMRTTVSMAQWSVKLPALLALIATQVGLLASQVSGFLLQWKVLCAECHTIFSCKQHLLITH